MRPFPVLNGQATKWLHRIGYVCTIVVALQILVLCAYQIADWRTDRELRGYSRTHDVPLAAFPDSWEAKAALAYLITLPSLEDMQGNGFRFASMPALATGGHYGLAIFKDNTGKAKGYLWVRYTNQRKFEHDFSIATTSYDRLVKQIDAMTIGYEGSADDFCLDGSPVAFERVDGSKIRSGVGNCSAHYQKLASTVLAFLESDPEVKALLSEAWELLVR